MKSKFKITICSDVDYEELIAEIYYDEIYVGLLNQDRGPDQLEIELEPQFTKPWFNVKKMAKSLVGIDRQIAVNWMKAILDYQ